MKKILLFTVFLLSACSLDFYHKFPMSTHIPSLTDSEPVFLKLGGTIWKHSSTVGDEYLFISNSGLKYALIHLKKGEIPKRYPENYQYISLSFHSISFPTLSYKVANVYQKSDHRDSFIGFRLLNSHTLLMVEDSKAIDVVDLLEHSKGTQWRLHI
ncbi:MAG: hypothetical protein ACRC0X_10295 [Brevinema sp.]